jgi:hypothetical protein
MRKACLDAGADAFFDKSIELEAFFPVLYPLGEHPNRFIAISALVPHDRRRTARRFEPDVEIHQELPSIRSPLRIAVTHHDVLAHGGDAQSGQWGVGRSSSLRRRSDRVIFEAGMFAARSSCAVRRRTMSWNEKSYA